jgi:hypothetical protein
MSYKRERKMYTVKIKDKNKLPLWIKVNWKGEIDLSNDRYKVWHKKGIIPPGRHYDKVTKIVTCQECFKTHKHTTKKYTPYQVIKRSNKNDENWD